MSTWPLGFSVLVATGITLATSVCADPVSKRSDAFAANYKTLTEDQLAPPQIAECIATGYDDVESSKAYDRLGFTRMDISKAQGEGEASISVPGEARLRKNGSWVGIVLKCGIEQGSFTTIDVQRLE
ncbi:MAG: BspC domain-containing protein [Phyllobacterium sp.]